MDEQSNYYHQQHQYQLQNQHQHHQQQPPSATAAFHPAVGAGIAAAASPVANGGVFADHGIGSSDGANAATASVIYPQSVAGKAPSPPSEIVRKKRGRPRKYVTAEAAAAAKAAARSSSSPRRTSTSKKRDGQAIGSPPSSTSSSKKAQLDSEAINGQCLMPHVINVQPGEDVANKIRIFVQQSMRESCILSASGAVCNVSLLQPATSGGSVTYDGAFDILSLSGSFLHTDQGERSGSLSACFSAANGQIIGGGLAGPLIAVGPVEVIVATFVIKTKRDVSAGAKGEASTTTMASPNNVSVSTAGYRPVLEPSGRYPVSGVDDHQNIGNFMIQHQGMHMAPSHSDWSTGPDMGNAFNYDFTGRTGHGTQGSPEKGGYGHLPSD